MQEVVIEVLRLSVAFIGVYNHLFEEIKTQHIATPFSLSVATKFDLGYLERWCEAAYACEFLNERKNGFVLTPLAENFLCQDSLNYSGFSIIRGLNFACKAEAYADFIRSGKLLSKGTYRISPTQKVSCLMMEGLLKPIFLREILPKVDAYSRVGERGGRLLDVGCGNGWFITLLAQKFPMLSGVGIDHIKRNVKLARDYVKKAHLQKQIRIKQQDILKQELTQAFDLISLNQVSHHLWKSREQIFSKLYNALNIGGLLAVWEPNYPKDREKLRSLAGLQLTCANMFEKMSDYHFLNHEEIENFLNVIGFKTTPYLVREGTSVVIIGEK